MSRSMALMTYLVRDYDEAIRYFVDVLGFALLEDKPLDNAKRWVRVTPDSSSPFALLLARAANPDQVALIGRQTGGRVFLFLQTDDFDGDFREMTERGVRFLESPRCEEYGRVVVFEDLYGHKWDLFERRST